MKVSEQFLKSKTNRESECEDSIFVSDNFAAVIDGVTGKSVRKFENETSGLKCSQLIKKALVDLPEDSTANQAVDFLTSAVYALYRELGIEDHVKNYPAERASACIALYSRFRNELWLVGDCQCLVDGTLYSNPKPVDAVLSDIRSLFIQTELKRGRSFEEMLETDSGREYILPLLKRQAVFQNSMTENDYNYGVIDGFKVPEKEIKIFKLSKPTSVILATDGYPRLFDTLAQSEAYLKEILLIDPLCFHEFKSTKGVKTGDCSFDDRAYLSISSSS